MAGPSFIFVFTVATVLVGVAADKFNRWGRNVILAFGVLLCSASCFITTFVNSYWQLLILRMGIGIGNAFCSPISTAINADLFSPTARGIANGIFNWGIYYGYGLAFVVGIYVTQADLWGTIDECAF